VPVRLFQNFEITSVFQQVLIVRRNTNSSATATSRCDLSHMFGCEAKSGPIELFSAVQSFILCVAAKVWSTAAQFSSHMKFNCCSTWLHWSGWPCDILQGFC